MIITKTSCPWYHYIHFLWSAHYFTFLFLSFQKEHNLVKLSINTTLLIIIHSYLRITTFLSRWYWLFFLIFFSTFTLVFLISLSYNIHCSSSFSLKFNNIHSMLRFFHLASSQINLLINSVLFMLISKL